MELREFSDPPVWQYAESFGDRTAVMDVGGRHSYADLLKASERLAANLCRSVGGDLQEARVAFMAPPGFDYAAALWGIWRAGGIAVPLCPQHPHPELLHVLEDAAVSAVVASEQFEAHIMPLAGATGAAFYRFEDLRGGCASVLPDVGATRRAMMLYTSGTTSKPKGVVLTHGNIAAQVGSLVHAWEWSSSDLILGVLPMYHIHGIVNVLCCALWSGAVWEALPKFEAREVFDRISRGGISLFMAVPTIYTKLMTAWHESAQEQREAFRQGCAGMRLMVSGSAALPDRTFHEWLSITGHRLLERYGMTEIGMALSNPLHGERRPGFVGTPLPSVEIALADEAGRLIPGDGCEGEICVRGGTVFKEYWGRPDATQKAFRNGWFCTGDIASRERGCYRILGRKSVDIIKSGGYRISALEVEAVLLEHPAVQECAVVGLEDAEWGECVSAAAVLRPNSTLTLTELRDYAGKSLARYKLPKRLKIVGGLPRNGLSKVLKPEVKRLFEQETAF